jgi:hypothetical protein
MLVAAALLRLKLLEIDGAEALHKHRVAHRDRRWLDAGGRRRWRRRGTGARRR